MCTAHVPMLSQKCNTTPQKRHYKHTFLSIKSTIQKVDIIIFSKKYLKGINPPINICIGALRYLIKKISGISSYTDNNFLN